MTNTKQPNKQQVRDWMAQRQVEHTPPPAPAEVRRQLGFDLMYNMDPQRQECSR